MKIYKIVAGDKGFKSLELAVSKMLNQGWECVGGVAFNNGFSYQAMIKEMEEKQYVSDEGNENMDDKSDQSFNTAMKRLDQLT